MKECYNQCPQKNVLTPLEPLTLLHSERPKLYIILAFLSAIGVKSLSPKWAPKNVISLYGTQFCPFCQLCHQQLTYPKVLKYWDTLNHYFPFVSNEILMVFRCPNIQAHYNEAVIYLNFGTPKNIEFSIWNKWKIYYL